MAFQPQNVLEKLRKLNATQESIETLSHYVVFHRRNIDKVATLWKQEFDSSNQFHQLNLLYLANDLVQNSKKRKLDFTCLDPIVIECTDKLFQECSESIKPKLERMVQVWKERNIFSKSDLDKLSLGNNEKEEELMKNLVSLYESVKQSKRDRSELIQAIEEFLSFEKKLN